MNNYFLYLDDTIHGPLSADEIENMLLAGIILPDTPVAVDGSSEWTTAKQLFNLQSLSAPAPRPPSVLPGVALPSSMNPRGLPARKPKQKSVWPAATAALVVVTAILALVLFLQTKRANPSVTMPAPVSTAAPTPTVHQAPPTPPIDPAQRLRKRAEGGDADAQFKLAMTCPNSGDFSNKTDSTELHEMIRWVKKAAEQGYPQAQEFLACCYQVGKGVIVDPAEEFKWFRKAAEQGNDRACLCVGSQYETGRGVQKNPAEAAKWFRQGAKGNVYCLLALGRLYLKGEDGVPKDLVQALMYLDLTLARDVAEPIKADVQNDRDFCVKDMTSDQIAEAKRLASEWKP